MYTSPTGRVRREPPGEGPACAGALCSTLSRVASLRDLSRFAGEVYVIARAGGT